MGWLGRILIGLAIVLVLGIAIVFMVGGFGSGTPANETQSMTAGNHTITVSGHYKNLTQESLADGIKIVVDGHEITINEDQLTMDGKTQVLEPDQDIEIVVSEAGAVEMKVVRSDDGSSAPAPQ